MEKNYKRHIVCKTMNQRIKFKTFQANQIEFNLIYDKIAMTYAL
jgi:hypothetical protein